VGGALSRALQVYGAGFGKFFVLTLIPFLPLLMLALFAGPGKANPALLAAEIFLQLILWSLATATCLYGSYQIMRGQSFSVGESFRIGLKRLGPVVGTAFLGGLLVELAFLLFVIPGLIVWCALYVATPACVIERLGAKASLRRSRELTKGHRWAIFGLILLVVVVPLIAGAGVAFAAGLIGAAAGRTVDRALVTVVTFALQTVMQSFAAVLKAVVYHDLRVAKEGVDIETIASVFD
jgi:hypothetical protein